jgi:hypothetical protein
MLTGRIRPTLDRALLREALGALEEQLLTFSTAELANRTGVTGHVVLLNVSVAGLRPPNGLEGLRPVKIQRRREVPPSRRRPACNQTRRFFGGRHPLWGIGVTSRIDRIARPAAARACIADSRPLPGP